MANMFNEDGTYNKTEWKAGDKITAVKLNKIELSLEAINNNDIDRHVEADSRLDILEERMANTPDNKQINTLEDMVKDNKDEADLAVYSINKKIESLESVNADNRLDILEGVNADIRLVTLEGVNADSRLDSLEVRSSEMINIKEAGADNKGVASCTDLVQTYIDAGYSIYFPKGIYKLNITLAPKTVIRGENAGLVTLIPDDPNTDVIKATLSCFSYMICDISIDGGNYMGTLEYTANGINLTDEGELAVQDLEPHIENVKITNVRAGLRVGGAVRGGLFKNIKAGACKIGIYTRGTDCIFKDCITAQTQSHGICNMLANNTFISCKAFLAGLSKIEGAGIKNQGSYNRFINCECQQNVLENLHMQNANYNIVQGVILDGAGYNSKKWFPTLSYNETGGEVPISSLRLYNSNGNIIDCTIIDGRLDCYCKTAIYNQWVGRDSKNVIRANINNYSEDSVMSKYILNESDSKYFKNNSVIINGEVMRDMSVQTPTIIDEQVEIVSGGFIINDNICHITLTLKPLKTQDWGNEILSGLPAPVFDRTVLTSSKPNMIFTLLKDGKMVYNPSITAGETIRISSSYFIK